LVCHKLLTLADVYLEGAVVCVHEVVGESLERECTTSTHSRVRLVTCNQPTRLLCSIQNTRILRGLGEPDIFFKIKFRSGSSLPKCFCFRIPRSTITITQKYRIFLCYCFQSRTVVRRCSSHKKEKKNQSLILAPGSASGSGSSSSIFLNANPCRSGSPSLFFNTKGKKKGERGGKR
jgi:hypothetical protein